MPDFITHSLEADRVLGKKYTKTEVRRALEGHPNLFRLGSQGPDLFFYCAFTGGGALDDTGQRLHEVEPELPLLLAEKHLKNGDSMSASYLFGWALHLMLDGSAHPFIEKRARETSGLTGMSESSAHVRFESAYEAYELQRERGITPRGFRWRCDIANGDAEVDCVVRCSEELCRAFGAAAPDRDKFGRAIRRLPALFRVVFDRSGFFCLAARFAGLFMRNAPAVFWHVKRPYRLYPGDVLEGSDIETLDRAVINAAESFVLSVGGAADGQ